MIFTYHLPFTTFHYYKFNIYLTANSLPFNFPELSCLLHFQNFTIYCQVKTTARLMKKASSVSCILF